MPDRALDEEAARELSRRRFARRQWARRWLAWRVLVVVAVVTGALVAATWLLLFSQVMAVQQVEVRGNALLSDGDVRRAAAVPAGEPLARTDLDGARARIEALPQVRSVDVSRAWPDGILVRIEEREAVAVVEIDGRQRGMDEDGVVFRDYRRAPAQLPRIRVAADTRGEAMAEGARVVGVLPDEIARTVDYVELASIDRISLRLRDGRTVVWGSAEASEDKARVLSVLLDRPATVYDVTVPGQPTTSD
ncbi:cell division protein FtsQ/DivIB [Nocardioides donggukensis]|uniref:Cell division protein FtsQ n=1 Tax=Nocardioides donggukensis TaxID=2774019 RepID=A0A927Q205_9ACTN|nr:FtsQ-type POTRA domain-containing protein [Nocardioides donggukensis]MBD8869221.1 FtsQ-type POTRA domain-containing protein [Nocardioides donggukensis]